MLVDIGKVKVQNNTFWKLKIALACDLEMARTVLTTLNGNIAIRINNNDNIIRYRIIQFTPHSYQILVCVEIF